MSIMFIPTAFAPSAVTRIHFRGEGFVNKLCFRKLNLFLKKKIGNIFFRNYRGKFGKKINFRKGFGMIFPKNSPKKFIKFISGDVSTPPSPIYGPVCSFWKINRNVGEFHRILITIKRMKMKDFFMHHACFQHHPWCWKHWQRKALTGKWTLIEERSTLLEYSFMCLCQSSFCGYIR